MEGNVKREHILDGRRTYQSLLSRLKKLQKSSRERGLGSGRKQRRKKIGNGKDGTGTGERVGVGERVDLGKGEEVALIDEIQRTRETHLPS